MKYNQLDISPQKKPIRAGRGIAAGRGKTAGRGTKGQNARKSGGVRPGFEGGQNPLMQRLPKLRGFRSIRPATQTVYTSHLNSIKGIVDNFSLAKAGIITDPYCRVKIVLNGEIKVKPTVKLQAATVSAQQAIKKAGGSFETMPRPQRQTNTAKKSVT